jgi:hypothetical protein
VQNGRHFFDGCYVIEVRQCSMSVDRRSFDLQCPVRLFVDATGG